MADMTREEIVNILDDMKVKIDIPKAAKTQINRNKALDRAIKALEQEPILDKIRTKIQALSPEPTAYDVVDGNPIKDAIWETIAEVLEIIDKYKAESEDK